MYNTDYDNTFANNNNTPKQAAGEPPVINAGVQVRRVGTFTLGVALILSGVLLAVAIFQGFGGWQFINFRLIASFAPVLLIMLGAEVLYSHHKAGSARLKYDIISGIICIGLAFICFIAALIPGVINESGYGNYRAQEILNARLEEEYLSVLQGEEVYAFYVNLWLYGTAYPANPTLKDVHSADSIEVYITLPEYTSADDFAKKVYEFVEMLGTATAKPERIYFSSYATEAGQYTVDIERPYQFLQTVENITARTRFTEYGAYPNQVICYDEYAEEMIDYSGAGSDGYAPEITTDAAEG